MSNNQFRLTEDDIVFRPNQFSVVNYVVGNALQDRRSWVVDTQDTEFRYSSITSWQEQVSLEQATLNAKAMLRVAKHTDYVVNNLAKLVPVLNDEEQAVELKHAGITSSWSASRLADMNILVKRQAVDRLLDEWFTPRSPRDMETETYGSRYFGWAITDPRMADDFLADAKHPLVSRAAWLFKRDRLHLVFNHWTYMRNAGVRGLRIERSMLDTQEVVTYTVLRSLKDAVTSMHDVRMSSAELNDARKRVLELQAAAQGTTEQVTSFINEETFTDMFENVKESKRAIVRGRNDAGRSNYYITPQAIAQAQEAWATIPIAEPQTPTSRTWGIEVETVRAHLTSRPRGWDDHADGSLEADSDDCTCNCDGCCDYGDHDCGSDECYGKCREFVSPILNSFNSNGLRQLCNDIPTNESNTSPGIHVHVGAADLTVADVGRLLFAYGVVSPLIEPLYFREERYYCKDTQAEVVRWWMRETRAALRTLGRVPTPRQVIGEDGSDRYHDVNTHALSEHGTIEFRAMGPYYDYEHLVRWAWFVREMVNVSRLNLPQRLWRNCQSLNDVITLLRTYGSESALALTTDNNEY